MTPRAAAAAYGVRVALDDLGDWGAATLIAEYDPDGPEIRVNVRAIARLCRDEAAERALIDEAIMHELYHHKEAIGAIERLGSCSARERAAREHGRSAR